MVAVNTDYAKTKNDTNHTKKILETVSKIGFTHVHWVHQWDGTDLYSVSEMRADKRMARRIKFKS